MRARSILSTMIYTHLVKFRPDDYIVEIILNVREASELVKSGFEYVTGGYNDGEKIFRKPK